MTVREGFKFVAADFTTRRHTFSYLDALQTGQPLVATSPTEHHDPCPQHEGDGLCVATTVAAASSGGQSASSAVGLLVTFDSDDVLAESDGKIRVRSLTVIGVFDPVHLIRLGLQHNLAGADLTGADLTGANLTGANLTGADLTGADLTGAYLTGADLTRADLTGANLTRANLTGADLTGAYLTGADLTGAYLTGAYLTGAKLPADFRVGGS